MALDYGTWLLVAFLSSVLAYRAWFAWRTRANLDQYWSDLVRDGAPVDVGVVRSSWMGSEIRWQRWFNPSLNRIRYVSVAFVAGGGEEELETFVVSRDVAEVGVQITTRRDTDSDGIRILDPAYSLSLQQMLRGLIPFAVLVGVAIGLELSL